MELANAFTGNVECLSNLPQGGRPRHSERKPFAKDLGHARRVTGMSGCLLKEREFRGQSFLSDCDDNTGFLLDFGSSVFAFCYGTAAGSLVTSFGSPTIFGVNGAIVGETLNGQPFDYPGREIQAAKGMNAILPHYTDKHPTEEFHVFEDLMQLVDLLLDGTATPSTVPLRKPLSRRWRRGM